MKRYISSFLALVIAVSMIMPVKAADKSSRGKELPVVGVLYDSDFVSGWDHYFSKLTGIGIPGEALRTLAWDTLDAAVSSVGFGGFTSEADLIKAANALNSYFSYSESRIPGCFEPILAKFDVVIVRTFLSGISGRYHFQVDSHPTPPVPA